MVQNIFVALAAVKSPYIAKSRSSAAAGKELYSSQESKQGVITLTARNFDSSIRDGNTWLVEFYSPWCG
jgi:Thioredoxin.